MMRGNNTIELNILTMIEVVQRYFDTVLFAKGAAPKVDNVTYRNDNYSPTFIVKTDEPTDGKEKDDATRNGA